MAAAGDTTPPTTSITSPANGATVSGTVTVAANASDNVGVSRVELYVDGGLIGSDTTAPYQIAWNTTTATNGGHGLQTRAFDAAGNVGSSAAVNVTVSNATGGGGELIVNGGFEGSASPWTLSGSRLLVERWEPALRHGLQHPRRLQQRERHRVPDREHPGGHPANLTFWLNITTSESLTTAFDFVFVEVRSTSGALAGHARQLQQPQRDASTNSYSQRSFSLAAWRGQTVRVQFRATTDVSLPTSFRVDDVSLS